MNKPNPKRLFFLSSNELVMTGFSNRECDDMRKVSPFKKTRFLSPTPTHSLMLKLFILGCFFIQILHGTSDLRSSPALSEGMDPCSKLLQCHSAALPGAPWRRRLLARCSSAARVWSSGRRSGRSRGRHDTWNDPRHVRLPGTTRNGNNDL